MIRAVYVEQSDGCCSVQLTGHAGSAPMGSDLVCAAASILMYTLARRIRDLQTQGCCHGVSIRMMSGDARVTFIPSEGHYDKVHDSVDTVMAGFKLLTDQYPEYIVCDLQY